MKDNVAPLKIYLVGPEGKTFACPKCGLRKEIEPEKLKLAKKGARLRCKCGELYELELRKCYRKEVHLLGRYKVVGKPLGGECIITDISMGGVGFMLPSSPNFKVGNVLSLYFRLPDPNRTEINLDVEVKNIKETRIGSEITDWKYNYRALGFFMMP